MSRVGEVYRLEPGQGRPVAGFFVGAASLLGFGRLFAEAPLSAPSTPAFTASESFRGADGGAVSDLHEVDRLAAHIAGAVVTGRAQRILITHAGSGASPLSVLDSAAFGSQLARALACEGRAILVVFGAGGGLRAGLSELIDGSASFSEAIHREAGSRLHILPSGHARPAPGAGLNVVLDALADTYDYVVLSAADEDSEALRRLSISVAPQASHVLITCPGQTGSPDMVALRDALKDEGAGEVTVVRISPDTDSARAAREAA